MNAQITGQILNLGVGVVLSLFIWAYYRRAKFAPDLRYLTFGPRFWTGVVDSLILWPIGFLTALLFLLDLPKSLVAFLTVVESLPWLLYTVWMHGRYGQTVGKMVTKVRVADFHTEGIITWRQAWLREGLPMVLSLGCLVWEVSGILSGRIDPKALVKGGPAYDGTFWLLAALPGLWFLAEILTMLTNKKRRALHDFIAGTVVVRTNIEESSPAAPPVSGSVIAPLPSS